tara:strand:- start:1337 stop:1669 length:333 start_codon:yes stop_codon:yes gene_type:complete
MEIFKLKDMKHGWYAGDFSPSSFKTDKFEACYRTHPKGEKWDTHYHEHITEINLLVKGKMKLQNTLLATGDIFVIKPFEIADPIFLEDCTIMCIKTPGGYVNDKISVEPK